jgi:8-oxo-dGTP pyrophosphatase MutT (NUDIX family)
VNTSPWRTLRSETRYENPWIRVDHFDVVNPNGGAGIYGVVHFKNRAIGIVALDEHDHTYLVGQWRYALEAYSWEIPEGGGPLHENPLEAAKRELEEETGFRAREWRQVLRMHLSNSVTDEECLVFLATGLEAGTAHPEDTEDLALKRVPFTEALRMVQSGEITDAVAVAGILQVALLRAQNAI